MNENTFFLDTMQGLLEAIAIQEGVIEMTEVQGMPNRTLRARSEQRTDLTQGEVAGVAQVQSGRF